MKTPLEQIKLLAIDIDGTLLNPLKQVTPRTREAIRAAQQAGIIVTLATARRYQNTSPLAQELGLDIPLVVCDGAIIIEHPHSKIIHTHPLDALIAQQTVEILVRHKVQPVVHHINGIIEETWTGHADFDNPGLIPYFTSFPKNIRRMHHDTLCSGQPDPLRVVAFASAEEIDGLIPEISELTCNWHTVEWGNYGCSEIAIMNHTCSKATGVKALADLLHIPLSQVMAIGDHTNDLQMLQTVGWGVAMGQAPESLKTIAHAVTADNTEDGAALAIERYILTSATHAA